MLHDDPDIDLEMRRHGDRVKVVFDSVTLVDKKLG
jgi:hypothetical protein